MISKSWFILGLPLVAACSAPLAAPHVTLAPDLGKRLEAEHAVVTSAHPAASEAGFEMLRKGGNAIDAAVATAFTVSVGEPQMSGMGGGGGMLIWLQDEQRAEYVDFYAAQLPESFRGLSLDDAPRTDLRTVAIPGEVAGLLEAHERFGNLSRAEVMAPAIRLAEEGFPINQILAQMIAMDSAKLARYPRASRVFLPDGRPLRAGDILRQPELANTLRLVAEQGRDGFYKGEVAEAVVATLNAGGHPASLADFAAVTPRWKRPMCGDYRGYTVLSAAPPQTGVQILQTLELLEPYDLESLGLPTQSAAAFDVLTSALRVGMSDSQYNQDPNWVDAPVNAVASPGYASARAGMVGSGRAPAEIEAGDPADFRRPPAAGRCARLDPYRAGIAGPVASTHASPSVEISSTAGGETTHLSVVDADGNAVSLSQTNSSVFGSGARVAGFFLNNSGIIFSDEETPFTPTLTGSDPWRVRKSTISPTIVLQDGQVAMVVGAPGGGRIPTEIVQNMVYVLDYDLDPLAALRMPRIYPSDEDPQVQLETGFPADVLADIREMGYDPVAESFGYARLYMIVRAGDLWIGVADPRHNGEVRGY
ncbi:MAG TPA: gamma-glutamyltransferase family protein [Longimicrobiaceae bacterium]|nr:gamma-glutamyltransferase family protein [Longimicrobiaceae bacterium]